MAARTRGGGVGLVVAMVVFVVLFLAGLFSTIIFHNNWKDAEKKNEDLRKDIESIYNSEKEPNLEVKDAVKAILGDNKGKSVVATLFEQKKDTLSFISPNSLTLNAAKSAVTQLERKVRDAQSGNWSPASVMQGRASIADAIKALSQDFETILAERNQLTGQLKTVTEQLAAVEAEKAKLEVKHRDGIEAVTTQLGTVVNANTTAQQTASASLKQLQDGQAKAAEEFQKQQNELQDKVGVKDREIQNLQRIIADLRSKLTSSKTNTTDIEFQPDGEILSVISEQNLVTIPLGKDDHLFLGLTFEVFDRAKGINKDEFNEVRGKATIEIVKIKDRSSEARIVRIERNANVFEGDLFINLVYDRYRTFKFYVYGKFDLNNDGRATEAETRRVKSMVSQWGGILAEEMNYEVDFLVLGVRPAQPRQPKEGDPPLTPEQIEENAALQKELLKFLELEGEARGLRVPILNQNRFLRLVGYYER